MICQNCRNTKTVINCTGELTIGTIGEASTDVYVYFKAANTGKLIRIETESDSDGLVVVELSGQFFANTDYKVWITLVTAENIEAYETIEIDGTEQECLIVVFQRVSVTNDDPQTLTIS